MELKNDRDALLDKVELYGFHIDDIDPRVMDSYIKENIVMVRQGAKYYLETFSGNKYSEIELKSDKYFDRLTYSIDKEGRAYGRIELSVNRDIYHNLNCMSPEDYQKKLLRIKKFLWDEYGIIISIEGIKYRSMEINKTVMLNSNYLDYRRAMQLLFFLFPKQLRLRDNSEHNQDSFKKNKIEDYQRNLYTMTKSSGKKGIEITFYDKTKQLCDYISLDSSYLRAEIKLKTPQKIKAALGTNLVFDLTQEKVNAYWNSFIKKNIEKPYEAHIKRENIFCKKMLKKSYIPGSRTWVENMINAIYNMEANDNAVKILDIKRMIDNLDCIITRRQNRFNVKQRLLKVLRSGTEKSIYIRDDDLKYEELISKLLI